MSEFEADNLNQEDKLFTARFADAVNITVNKGKPKFVGFLNMHRKNLAEKSMKRLKCENYSFWGGYESAERIYLGVFPDFIEPDPKLFPISAIEITWKFQKLSHRDFMGALISLGIEHGSIGDIIISEDKCILFIDSALSSFVIQNLTKISKAGVNCSEINVAVIKKADEFKQIKTTVASQRLDCAVSALVKESRSQAEKLIIGGRVSVNYEVISDTTYKIESESTVSIRGYGRFIIEKIGPLTKKERLGFLAKKYL